MSTVLASEGLAVASALSPEEAPVRRSSHSSLCADEVNSATTEEVDSASMSPAQDVKAEGTGVSTSAAGVKRARGAGRAAAKTGRADTASAQGQANGAASDPGTTEEEGCGRQDAKTGSGLPDSPSKSLAADAKRGTGAELPPPQTELEAHLEVKVGAKCTCYDSRDGKWYKCVIVKLDGNMARVHFEGWSSKFDVTVESNRLRPAVKKKEVIPLSAPVSVSAKDTTERAVTLQVAMPHDVASVHEFSVQVDGQTGRAEIKIKKDSCKFDAPSSSYTFDCKGLDPAEEYCIQVKAFARGFKWSEFSPSIQVRTEEEAEERRLGGALAAAQGARSAKERAEYMSKKQAGLLTVKPQIELSEEEQKARAEKARTKNHDHHCDLCLGWDGPLIYCHGGCKRAFHAECVHVDAEDMHDNWTCQMCEANRLRCGVCLENVKTELAVRCSRESCQKAFHPNCLATYMQKPLAEVQPGSKISCPRHECLGCGMGQNEYTGKQGMMIRCIRCPASYHFKCIPSHGYVEYPEPYPYIICDKHTHDVRTFKELEVKSALKDSKIEPFTTAGIKEPAIKTMMDSLQLTLPQSFRVPARFAESRNYQGNKPEPFKLLRSNLYTMGKPKTVKQDIQACDCKATFKTVSTCLPVSQADAVVKNGGGTCGDSCENRQTMFECLGSVCHADCQNQRLQKRQYARLELFKTTDGRGWGLKALEDVPEGGLVQEYIGEVLTTEAFKDRAASYGLNKPVYFFNINSEMVIDASAMGSMARFINHSCDPNCRTEKWSVGAETRIAIVAKRDIKVGEEVTYNYEFESFGVHEHKCMCGAANCSGFLGKRPKTHAQLAKEAKEAEAAKKKKRKRKVTENKEPVPGSDAAGGMDVTSSATPEDGEAASACAEDTVATVTATRLTDESGDGAAMDVDAPA